MAPTYKRHPMDKRRPAPTRVADPGPQLVTFGELLTAFARDLRAGFEPLSALLREIGNTGYEARLHARHPEYHGGKPLAQYILKTGAYTPITKETP